MEAALVKRREISYYFFLFSLLTLSLSSRPERSTQTEIAALVERLPRPLPEEKVAAALVERLLRPLPEEKGREGRQLLRYAVTDL